MFCSACRLNYRAALIEMVYSEFRLDTTSDCSSWGIFYPNYAAASLDTKLGSVKNIVALSSIRQSACHVFSSLDALSQLVAY